MHAANSPLRGLEACPGGGDVVAAQLYCVNSDYSEHPFSINVFEGNLSVSDVTRDVPLLGLLGMAQEAAASYTGDERRQMYIKAVQESEIVGVALSQVCGRKTDGIVHGPERLASIIFSIGTAIPIENAEYIHNPRAPWMVFAPSQDIMLGTLPLTHTEMTSSTLVGALPVYRKEKKPILGIRRKPDEHYMGIHRGIDGDAIEHVVSRGTMFGLTLGEFLRYSV